MTITLEEFMKDFTPAERAQVAGRTAELVKGSETELGRVAKQAALEAGMTHKRP